MTKHFIPKTQSQFEENLILSGIVKYGRQGYADCCDIIKNDIFNDYLKTVIFTAMGTAFSEGVPINVTSVFQRTGLPDDKYQEVKEILSNDCCDIKDIRPAALTLRKRKLKDDAITIHRECINKLSQLDGTEPTSKLIALSESALFDLVAKACYNDSSGPIKIKDIVREQVEEWMNSPAQNVGLPLPWPKFNNSIGGGLRSGVHLIGARLKALRHGSKVYTNNGPVLIEDVKVGDVIKHPFKGDTTVTAVWPHENKEIYRIYFRDGDFVDCCEDHLWHVYKRYPYNNQKKYLKTTKELIGDLRIGKKQEYKWDIPLPSAVEFAHKDVPIDPYALGVLLGDGSVANNTCVYHTADDEIHQYMLKYATSIGCEVKIDCDRKDNKCTSYRINSLQNKLRESGIWGQNCYVKSIPKDYIYNSKEVRLAVLAGLMDTDGTCVIDKKSKQSRSSYSSVSKQLCLDLKEIVQSLGGLCSIIDHKTSCNGKIFFAYTCEVRLPKGINPFRLKRKSERFTNRTLGKLKRTIVKIEKVGVDNATCLTLSDNDGLFMTDNYVVTHNTGKTSIALMTALHAASLGFPVLILDTEMRIKDVLPRMIANMSEVEINTIERGTFAKDEFKKKCIFNTVGVLEKMNISHRNVGGYEFDEIISIIRRWIYTDVGLKDNGEANPCLVIFDYFKVMSARELVNINESQALGFQVSKLVDFSKKFEFPNLSFCQLNRDGITKEDSSAVGSSDKLAQYGNSLSIFKRKTEAEMAKDGLENGNRRMITTDSRYGGEAEFQEEHIHMQMKKECCILKECNFTPKKDKDY